MEAQQKKLAQAFHAVTHNPDFQRVMLSEDLLRDSLALLDSSSVEVVRLTLAGFHALTHRRSTEHVRVVARLPGFALRLVSLTEAETSSAEIRKLASDILNNFESFANGGNNRRRGSKRDASVAVAVNDNNTTTTATLNNAVNNNNNNNINNTSTSSGRATIEQKFEGKFRVANLNNEKDENRIARGLMSKQRELGIISVHVPPASSEVHLMTRSNDSNFTAKLMTVLAALGFPLLDVVTDNDDTENVNTVNTSVTGTPVSTPSTSGISSLSSIPLTMAASYPLSTPIKKCAPSLISMPDTSDAPASSSSLVTPIRAPVYPSLPARIGSGLARVSATPNKGAMTLFNGFNATMSTGAAAARARRQQQSVQNTAARAGLMSGVVGYFF